MGTVKIPYNWCGLPQFDDMPFDTRWHLVALISLCSRRCRVDGVITWDEALAASDVPDPERCTRELLDDGHLARTDGGVCVVKVAAFLTSKRTEAQRDAARDREREKGRKRKARTRAKVTDFVFARDDWTCKHCGTGEDLTVDHIYPQALGGSDDPANLQTLCRVCNAKKGIRVE